MASEASCVYILNGQKFIKNALKWSTLVSFRKIEVWGEPLVPDNTLEYLISVPALLRVPTYKFRKIENTGTK